MGSSKPQVITTTPITLDTDYGIAYTPPFDVSGNDFTTTTLDVNAGTGTTAITIKPQVEDLSGNWIDLYRDGGDEFVADELTFPLTSSTNNQRRAVRLDTRGISIMRFISKTVNGDGQINSVEAVRDGSSTSTPRAYPATA